MRVIAMVRLPGYSLHCWARSVFTPHRWLMFVLAFPTPPKGLAEGLTPEEYGTRNTNLFYLSYPMDSEE